jgi:hypothetical protein
MMKIPAICAALIAGGLLALAGCSRESAERAMEAPSPSTIDEKTAAPAQSEAVSGGAAGNTVRARSAPAAELPQERMVIKTASVALRVKNVDAAFARAIQLTEESGGYVQSSTQSVEGGDRADLTLRVPPARFLPLIATLESLGAEESKSIGGEDVTQEFYDLDAELSNKTEVRARLFQLLDRAAKVSDAIQVEEQLERVGADVNRIKGRMKYLQTMVGLSTVNLSISSEARASAVDFLNWSLVGNGFIVAARVLVQALFFILQALVVIIPLGAVGGAAAWGIVTVVRRRRAAIARPKGKK